MKNAFTLAEVLITLGIIGLVAAVTLPVVINNQKEKALITAWKKNYSDISNAVLGFQKDDLNMVGVDEYNILVAFSKYIKHTKICHSNKLVAEGCSPKSYPVYTYDGRLYVENLGECGGGASCLLTVNGSIICVDSPIIFVDVNGYKAPNTIGKDIFAALLNTTNNTIHPAVGHRTGWGATDDIVVSKDKGDGTCQATDWGWGCSAEKLLK